MDSVHELYRHKYRPKARACVNFHELTATYVPTTKAVLATMAMKAEKKRVPDHVVSKGGALELESCRPASFAGVTAEVNCLILVKKLRYGFPFSFFVWGGAAREVRRNKTACQYKIMVPEGAILAAASARLP